MSTEFGAWLDNELSNRRWSHRELARKTGLSQSIVSKSLSGERKVSADFCIKVAEALGEPPERLLRLAHFLPATSTDEATLQELIDVAKNMSPEDQRDLLRYARFRFQQGQDS